MSTSSFSLFAQSQLWNGISIFSHNRAFEHHPVSRWLSIQRLICWLLFEVSRFNHWSECADPEWAWGRLSGSFLCARQCPMKLDWALKRFDKLLVTECNVSLTAFVKQDAIAQPVRGFCVLRGKHVIKASFVALENPSRKRDVFFSFEIDWYCSNPPITNLMFHNATRWGNLYLFKRGLIWKA